MSQAKSSLTNGWMFFPAAVCCESRGRGEEKKKVEFWFWFLLYHVAVKWYRGGSWFILSQNTSKAVICLEWKIFCEKLSYRQCKIMENIRIEFRILKN